MSVLLQLHALAAWAPGLDSDEAWRSWAKAPWAPTGDALAPARDVPPMLRRRLDPLGRAALQVAAQAVAERPAEFTVFVSRRGAAQLSLDLLGQLAAGEPLSPAGFGLSVHNAIAAQLSMWRGDRGGYAALAAGCEGVEQGLHEIAARLHGAPAAQALLVVYEAPVPAVYARFRDEPDACFAWAARWSLGRHGQSLCLESPADQIAAADPAADGAALPAALDVLRHLLCRSPAWRSPPPARPWRWRMSG